ncbi:MAG: hypothetical protein CMK54_04675 [Proteobacteria bacterium]|nr:hypothetical protein [Pseudomonadota bacterium]
MNQGKINLIEDSPLKILVVSQKGGVGKSTLSANFSAYCGNVKKKKSLLLDCDPHASASSWLKALKPKNVDIKHHLVDDFTAQRWFIGMRNIVRKNQSDYEILVCDLTWTKSMNSEFVGEFDLLIIPTSVSLIEIEATSLFIKENLNKNSGKLKGRTPDVLICPSQVIDEDLKHNPFDSKTFDFPFFLLPPIPSDPEVRQLFEKGYAFESGKKTKASFIKTFNAILQAGQLKKSKNSELSNYNSAEVANVKFDNGKNGMNGVGERLSEIETYKTIRSKSYKNKLTAEQKILKVKKILNQNKKDKSSWFRRLVSW